MQGNGTAIIDADGHFMEVHDTWTKHLDRAFWDRRFDVVEDADGVTWTSVGERKLKTLGRVDPGTIKEEGKEAAKARKRGLSTQGRAHDQEQGPTYLESLQPGAWQPAARVAMLDEMGIDAQIIFPTVGLSMYKTLWKDVPAMCANYAAYNRWVAEFNSHAPDRLLGVGHVSFEDPEWAAAEVRRCAQAGMRGVMIPAASTSRGVPIFDPSHDQIWQAFTDHNVAACFHISTHKRPFTPEWYDRDDAPSNKVMDLVFQYLPAAATVTALIAHGKLEQFPTLRIGVMELTGRWVPEWLRLMDINMKYHAIIGGGGMPHRSLKPSEYFHRQVWVSPFHWEHIGDLVDTAGPDTFMFCSDWPHPEGSKNPVPDYLESIPQVDDAARAAIMGGNAAGLLGLS